MTTRLSTREKPLLREPYYPPGYCGYSPQIPFQFGDTYGTTTSRLLTDPTVAKSGRYVLTNIYPSKPDRVERDNYQNNDWIRMRKQSWGDKKLNDRMVPGYTGYIPKKENYFGQRAAKICSAAARDFTLTMNEIDRKRKELVPIAPMAPKYAEPKPYVSLNQKQHSVSPYFMATTQDKDKTFVSGYTGFIPRSRSRFAQTYPNLTHEALKEFTKEQQRVKKYEKQPLDVPINRPSVPTNNSIQEIYVDDGLLPRYTGYLPGHKFRFGITFGTSSRHFHHAPHQQDLGLVDRK